MNLVIDTSFIMSAVLPDEKNIEVDAIYDKILDNTYSLHVPAIFYLECQNTLMMAVKRNRITMLQYDEYIQVLGLLPINVDRFCSIHESLYLISKFSSKHGLSAYDTSYLELAIRLSCPIATFDKKLIASATLENIALII